MQRKLPPLNALRAFESAGRLGSFSGAGEELNVSHSSISRHVRGLERRLNIRLFKNVNRGVELTTAGKAYLQAITGAFDKIAEATDRLVPELNSKISISCEPTFALKWLTPAIGKFQALHPEIELEIDTTWEIADLAGRECDLAIRFCSQPLEGLESDLLSQSPLFPVGAPGLFGPDCDVPSVEQLKQVRFLQENHADQWEKWTQAANIPFTPSRGNAGKMRTMFAIEAAVAGQGLALVSMELVYNDLKAGRLCRYSQVGIEYGSYRLVYTKPTLRRKPVQAFRNWLLDATRVLREETSSDPANASH